MISEKQIEDALIEYIKTQPTLMYLGRQINLPMGRLDVLGFEQRNFTPIVFEVKKGKIKEIDVIQLLGYMYQVEALIDGYLEGLEINIPREDVRCHGILVGSGVDRPMIKRFSKASEEVGFWAYGNNDGVFTFDFIDDHYLDFDYFDAMNFATIAKLIAFDGAKQKAQGSRGVIEDTVRYRRYENRREVVPPLSCDQLSTRQEILQQIFSNGLDVIWGRGQ